MDPVQKWIYDTFLSAFVDTVTDVMSHLQISFASGFISDFKPSLSKFYNAFGGMEITEKIFQVFTIMAITIAFLILAYNLILPAFSMIFDAPQGPGETIIRFIISIILILSGKSIVKELLDIGLTLWDKFEEIAVNLTATSFEAGISALITGYIPFTEGTYQDESGFFYGLSITPGIGQLIIIVFIIILLVAIIKLLVEIVERYIVVCFLYYFFPLGACTIVSRGTSQIFKSYIRMIFCQLFLLLVNLVSWTAVCCVIADMFAFSSFENYIFTYALLKSFTRIDNYMRSMGLTVAQTSGNILDAISGTVYSGLANFANISRTASGFGRTMSAFGIASKSPTLVSAGNAINGMPTDIGTLSRNFPNGVNKAGSIASGAATAAMNKNLSPMERSGISKMLNNTQGGVAATMEGVFGPQFMTENGNNFMPGLGQVTDMKYNSDGTFSMDISGQNGSLTDKDAKATLSMNPPKPGTLAGVMQDTSGNNWFATVSDKSGRQLEIPAEGISFTPVSGGYTAEEMAYGIDVKELGIDPGETANISPVLNNSSDILEGYKITGIDNDGTVTSESFVTADGMKAVDLSSDLAGTVSTNDIQNYFDSHADEMSSLGYRLNETGNGLDWSSISINESNNTNFVNTRESIKLEQMDKSSGEKTSYSFSLAGTSKSGGVNSTTRSGLSRKDSVVIGSPSRRSAVKGSMIARRNKK